MSEAHNFTGMRQWGMNPSWEKPCVVCGVVKKYHPVLPEPKTYTEEDMYQAWLEGMLNQELDGHIPFDEWIETYG